MDGRTPQRPDREVQISAKQSNLTRKHPADKVPQGLLRGRGEGPDLPGGGAAAGRGGRPMAVPTDAQISHRPVGTSIARPASAGSMDTKRADKVAATAARRGQSWHEESSGNMTKNETETLCKLTNRKAKRWPELTISLQKTILSGGVRDVPTPQGFDPARVST